MTACSARNSSNILEHRFGESNGSARPLYAVQSHEDVEALERHLFEFFCAGSSSSTEFAPRFDRLADHLRHKRLGCTWSFPTYLAFLLAPEAYFPVRPRPLDRLLEYLGFTLRLSGRVEWLRYSGLLAAGDSLRCELAALGFGRVSAVQLQSYMWVVAYLLDRAGSPSPESIDWTAAIERRMRLAENQERIGLSGERFVLESERRRLECADRADLAARVTLASEFDTGAGFDVLSFAIDGTELHLEVKTTTRHRTSDLGFHLSENERKQAEVDPAWRVVRVWDIDGHPHSSDLGNVVQGSLSYVTLEPSTWFVRFDAAARLDAEHGACSERLRHR